MWSIFFRRTKLAHLEWLRVSFFVLYLVQFCQKDGFLLSFVFAQSHFHKIDNGPIENDWNERYQFPADKSLFSFSSSSLIHDLCIWEWKEQRKTHREIERLEREKVQRMKTTDYFISHLQYWINVKVYPETWWLNKACIDNLRIRKSTTDMT